MTLIERLGVVMDEKKWEHADLVRVSGQTSSVVSQWLGKGSKLIKTIGKLEAAERIAKESGYCALWIAKGIGPMKPASGANARRQSWPFEAVPYERIERLTPFQRGRVEQVMLDVLSQMDASESAAA